MARNNSRVRELREAASMTAAALEVKSGVSQPMISLVERGFWGSPSVRAHLSEAFGKKIRDVFPNVPVTELKKSGQD